MNTSYYRGSLLPSLQSETNDFDPQRGYIYRATFKGLGGAQMQTLQQEYAAQGIAVSLTYLLGVTTLEVVDSTEQFTLDTWDLDGEEERNDLMSHNTIMAIQSRYLTTDPETSIDVVASMKNGLSKDSQFLAVTFGTADSPDEDFRTDISALDLATLQIFYNLALRGSTEFQNDADGTGYVLKHTTNVSNTWTENIADSNVGMIYSTAELITEVTNVLLWINPLDARRVYKISNIPVPLPQLGYFWGWKKSRSNEQTAANNRVSIQTHYTLALWNTSVLYTAFP